MEVISPKSGEDKKKRKKRSSPEIEVSFLRNQVKIKKKQGLCWKLKSFFPAIR